MSRRVVLDPSEENRTTPGYAEIANELKFLTSVDGETQLFIRGKFLCDWAAEVAHARGWDRTWLVAPSSKLRQLCPALSEEDARRFLGRLPESDRTELPASVMKLVAAKWPELAHEGKSEIENAWGWLLWRINTRLEGDEEAVVKTFAASCFPEQFPALRRVYESADPEEAWVQLKSWLGCEPRTIDLPNAPEQVPPPIVIRLRSEWRVKALDTQGMFFERLVNTGATRELLCVAAEVVTDYLRHNPAHLTPELLALLKPFLTRRDWMRLQEQLPPADPGMAPNALSDVLHWYTSDYLDFRVRVGNTPQYTDRVQEIGRAFGLWYLKMYSDARTGGVGNDLASWNKTARMASEPDCVKLLIVLDGLGYIDAKLIIQLVAAASRRLSLDDASLALAPLPTVTHFAKPALMAGVTPTQAIDESEIGTVETRDTAVIAALNAAIPPNVVIWSVLEPDKTYHKPLDSRTLSFEVESRLQSISNRIARIVDEVDVSKRLRVYITTDHGRLLSESKRTQVVPHGMMPHGRAAWGLPGSYSFDSDGIFVDGVIAYLDPARFGIPNTAAVVLSEDAFLMADGKSGVESFTHGGVFPEEVLIPWLEFTRDRGPLEVSLKITGNGIAGASGIIQLEVKNTSQVRIEIVDVQLPFAPVLLSCLLSAKPLSRVVGSWTVSNWPQKSELAGLLATVVFELPTGERESHRIFPVLTVDEMYTRDTILDDLL